MIDITSGLLEHRVDGGDGGRGIMDCGAAWSCDGGGFMCMRHFVKSFMDEKNNGLVDIEGQRTHHKDITKFTV